MLTLRDLTPEDRDLVVPMVQAFYRSDAVDHPVDAAILERSFQDAASPAEPLLRGLLIQWEGKPAGYMYLTQCYSAEVGDGASLSRRSIWSRNTAAGGWEPRLWPGWSRSTPPPAASGWRLPRPTRGQSASIRERGTHFCATTKWYWTK